MRGPRSSQNGDGELAVARWYTGTVKKERRRAHDEDADRGDGVEPTPVLLVGVRSQDEYRDQSVAVTRREADRARGAHADDGDDHATDQHVHVDLAAFAKSAEEDR